MSKKFKDRIEIFNDHAEIILIDRKNNEKARALIGLEDVIRCKEYTWFLSTRNYVLSKTQEGKNIKLHRFIMDILDKPKVICDHIDRNPLNNQKNNLRLCTVKENKYNNSKQRNNTSGVVGVYWYKPYNKWKAQIKKDRKDIFLGYFNNFDEAVKVRKNAEIKYFGEFYPKDND